ncbi:MAG: protein kinase [Thermoanaerobaculia bacterium]
MIRELGKGAMGVVYLGRDPVIGRLVALKTIRSVSEDDVEQREFQERFLREAQAAGILSHPNIVTVHDVGEDSSTETSFIAMEYVEGKNLKQLLGEKTPFTFERVAEIIGQVAEALDYAHRRGIVHRDVKPANIIITPENQVKITDFGIAKTEKSNLTSTGQFLGTPNYMSPEQVTGDAVDGRSDLFSLGVVLYELLTRKKPFTADNLTSISYKIVHEQFVPPETYDASIPAEFASVLERALAKDPGERFQRGNDFALALYEYKAREEERQMLRDLGQMVAEAEKLGPVATVTAPPTPLPPSPPPTPPPMQAPPAGRSPFDILAAAPAAPPPPRLPDPEDDLATREVVRPLPATAYVAASVPDLPSEGGGEKRAMEDWQLDEPTRSKKAPPPPPPADEAAVVDVDASLPGPEVVVPVVPEPTPVPSATKPRGVAVSPFDGIPSAPGLSDERPDGATEIIQVGGLAGFTPPPGGGTDRPTEILQPVAPPVPEPISPPPAAVLPEPFVDRPTEILRPIAPPPPPASPTLPAAPPAPPAPVEPFVDRPTEILRPIAPPSAEKSERVEKVAKPPEPSIVPPAPAPLPPPVVPPPSSGDRPTEILRSPFPPPAASGPAPLPADVGEEGATERIVDAMKLARAGAPAPKPPSATLPAPPPSRPPAPAAPRPPAPSGARPAVPPAPKPASAAAKLASSAGLAAPGPAAPSTELPPVELEPIPVPATVPPQAPAGPVLKRAVNGKFVALIIGLVLVAAGVVAGSLWSRKAKIDAQAAVDEVREREVQELKALMEDGNRLLAAGNASQALEKFREVIRRKPDSAAAREALARAEEQAKAKQAGEEVGREVETRLAAARQAAEEGQFDRALDELSAVLLLQPDNADAQSIRASVKAAQAEKAAAEKKAAAELAKKKKPTPVPTPVREVKAAPPVETPKPATPTPGVSKVRIVFQSPAPEGYVMVRRNDKEIFRRQFDFGRKSAGGLVEGVVEVPSGPASFKAWAIPTNRSFNGYEAADLVVPGGETRSLVLELNASGKLVLSLR